jgi:hypothetical protein
LRWNFTGVSEEYIALIFRVKQVASKKQEVSKGSYLLGFLFDVEDGGTMSLRNVREFPPEYMSLHSRRQYSS